MRYDSPLRYPGGKAKLAPTLRRIIELNKLSGCAYFEPFAGGAGAALRLLREGLVSELHLNDLDPRIAAFWHSVLNEPERFVEAILSIEVSVAEWKRQQQICLCPDQSNLFDLGFAAFYLNRCNRSGVILDAAPIGGYAQMGSSGIDARFNKENLAQRVLAVSRKREQIHITNKDAYEFLSEHLSHRRELNNIFVYLDPPYYSKGSRLYLDSYTDEGHRNLASYVQQLDGLNWVASYDDTSFIRELYTNCVISNISLQYSLQRKRRAWELMIAPSHVQLPASVAPIETHERSATSV